MTYENWLGVERIVTTPRVCAEPSPDALQATAAALAGSGSASRDDIQAALQLSGSTAESAASFGLRTQSIQLLRDSYYRLCEAFLSDGIDSIAFDVMQRRFQNHIIAILAVEQLTGVVRGGQARVSTNAGGDSGTNVTALIAGQVAARECHKLRVWHLAHAGFSHRHALKRVSNMIASWFLAANHSLTFLPPFSKLRIAR